MAHDTQSDEARLKSSNELLALQMGTLASALRERNRVDHEWFCFIKEEYRVLREENTRQTKSTEAANRAYRNAFFKGSALGGLVGGLFSMFMYVIGQLLVKWFGG